MLFRSSFDDLNIILYEVFFVNRFFENNLEKEKYGNGGNPSPYFWKINYLSLPRIFPTGIISVEISEGESCRKQYGKADNRRYKCAALNV